MNKIRYVFLFILPSIIIMSCRENDPQPLQSEAQAVLLAGEKGKSKTWKVTDGTIKEGEGAPRFELAFSGCFLDNIYTFKNNDAQEYDVTEGETICDSRDPAIVESGTWAFTTDGKIIIILPNNLTGSFNVLFAALPFPATVVELTQTSLKIRMEVVDGVVHVVYTLNFVKIK